MEFNRVIVTWAREAREMSQSQLASGAGMSQGTISKIESGTLIPSDDQLASLARALEVPSTLFFQQLAFRNLPLSFYRKQVKVTMTQLKSIRARTNFVRLQLRRLLADVNVPALRLVRTEQRGFATAARAAKALRTHWHLPPGPISNLTRAMEDAGILVVPFEVGSARVDGLSMYDPQDDLPPVVFYNPALPWDRIRFTLAHEVGHIVLHHHLTIQDTDCDYEGEAHAFAQEFLMPAVDIRGHLPRLNLAKLAALKGHWRVSMQALIMRAHSLERITYGQKEYLFKQMSARGYRTKEPVETPAEEPTLLGEVINYYLNQLKFSEQQLSAELHLLPFAFRRQYRALLPSIPDALSTGVARA